MDAARHWASGGKQDLTAQKEALLAMGLEADLSEREKECVDLDIWPENDLPLTVLRAMRTQWLRAGMAGRVYALDYNAISPVMRYLQIPRSEHPDIFQALQICEISALEVFNSREE